MSSSAGCLGSFSEPSHAGCALGKATNAFRKATNALCHVTGAAGGIGQPLALLMKMNPLVGELSLYDVVGTPGVGADLSHIDTAPKACCWMPSAAGVLCSCSQLIASAQLKHRFSVPSRL